MPYFAEINTQTNEVLRVIVAKSKLWCEYELGGTWVATEKGKCGKGWFYYPDINIFSSRQPYPSWTLDDNCIWQPPTTRPDDDKTYVWNEETQSWDENGLLS